MLRSRNLHDSLGIVGGYAVLFNSMTFLYLFLPVVYVVYWGLKTRQGRYVWLTISGYAFYSFWDFRFCSLMAFSTVVSYLAGLGFLRWETPSVQRRICLIVPVVTDLMLLGFFKYAGFAVSTAKSLAAALGIHEHIPVISIVLPIGISFYTFHTISYIVDSYRGTVRPTKSFFEFSCYVSLFCQLVAGPIVRFRQIERDLEAIGTTPPRLTGTEAGPSL